jgi:two-component system, cell cycle response regulator
VADMVDAVGRRLRLSEDELLEVRRAAALHDIGKVAIPDAILHAPRALDNDEWQYMRQHTIIGERIINAAPALTRVAAIVRASHERWDGHGYPDALVGEAIPLGARIVAVADAFDAMTSPRPYSRPRAAEAALKELESCAGTQFDPAVVEAFAVAWRDRSLAAAA